MTLTLELLPEQETELQKQAAAEGLAPDRYALDLLLEQIREKAKARPFYETATVEEWVKAWHDWTHSHDPNTPVLLDDSREVIYSDERGIDFCRRTLAWLTRTCSYVALNRRTPCFQSPTPP